jgi:hypothetical protein
VRAAVHRDYGVADLLMRAVTRNGDHHESETLAEAWKTVIADDQHPEGGKPHRAALLAALVGVLKNEDRLDLEQVPDPPPVGFLQPVGDPWAGWWGEDLFPQRWPVGRPLDRGKVIAALRRLPLRSRLLLILRDAAGLDAATVDQILGDGDRPSMGDDLDRARADFVGWVGELIGPAT